MTPTLADVLNGDTPLEHDGKTYRLRQTIVIEEAQFTRYLEGLARDAAGRFTDMPEDQQDRLMRMVNEDIAAGVHEWGWAVCVRHLQGQLATGPNA